MRLLSAVILALTCILIHGQDQVSSLRGNNDAESKASPANLPEALDSKGEAETQKEPAPEAAVAKEIETEHPESQASGQGETADPIGVPTKEVEPPQVPKHHANAHARAEEDELYGPAPYEMGWGPEDGEWVWVPYAMEGPPRPRAGDWDDDDEDDHRPWGGDWDDDDDEDHHRPRGGDWDDDMKGSNPAKSEPPAGARSFVGQRNGKGGKWGKWGKWGKGGRDGRRRGGGWGGGGWGGDGRRRRGGGWGGGGWGGGGWGGGGWGGGGWGGGGWGGWRWIAFGFVDSSHKCTRNRTLQLWGFEASCYYCT